MEQNVLEEIRQIVQEYVKEVWEIEKRRGELSEEEVEKLIEVAQLRAIDRLRPYFDDVDLKVIDEFGHYTLYGVGKKEEGVTLKVVFAFARGGEVEDVWVEDHPNINEVLTPFTHSLVESVPWERIRDVWYRNIYKIVCEVAWAEIRGELKEKIDEIEERVARELWVYDYQHLYKALKKTREKFSI